MHIDASAMTTHTIPRKEEGLGAYYPGNDFGRNIDLSMKTYVRHEWHGINGTTMVSNYESPNVANTKGSMLFMVPTNRSAFDYKNCLDVYFENVGRFQGRRLNARLSVDSVKFGAYTPNGKYTVSYSSNPTGIFLLRPISIPEMFFGRSDQEEWFPGLEQRYDAVKDITMTLTITYADTGAVANIPFYQYVSDIDNNNLWNTYGAQEGITFGNGFTNDLYVYSGFRCTVNNKTIKVPNDGKNHNYSDFYVPPPVPGATSGEKQSDDTRVAEASWFCNACWGATTSGQFTMTFHGSNAVADMNIRSPWIDSKIIKTPTKSGITPSNTPETMYWSVRTYLPNLTSEILSPFRSLTFTDTIPSGQTYQSCSVFDEAGNDISNQASVSYNSSNRTVSVTMSSGFLQNKENYGKSIFVRIYCNWNSGVTEAENIATVIVDSNPIPTPPSTVHKYEKTNVGLHKFVINKKDSYGPGDEVEFLLIIDTASYNSWKVMPSDYEDKINAGWWPQYSKQSFYDEDTVPVGVWCYLTKPVLTDNIPEGLELVGEPIANPAVAWRSHFTVKDYMSIAGPPYSREDMQWAGLKHHVLSSMYSRNNGITILGNLVDYNSKNSTDFSGLVESVGKFGPLGFMSVEKVFDGINWKSMAQGQYPHIVDKSRPADLCTNRGAITSYSKNKIQISTKGYTLFRAWNAGDIYGTHYGTFNPTLYSDQARNEDMIGQTMGCTAIYYKCRVTGEVTNVDVTNTSSFTCEVVGNAIDSKWNDNGEYYSRTEYLVCSQPLSAEASATIHLGGYEVTTEVVNGTIDDDVYDISPGSNVGIGYDRHAGHYLESVHVDGNPVSISAYDKLYQFKNINQSHHIKVVYNRGYDITTEAVHGLIDAPYYGVKPGSSKSIAYEPEDGYMLSTITVDGKPVTTVGNLSSYLFSNVQANHHIKVVFIPQYKITTSIEHGTITPMVTKIPPGESRSITYSPNSGYYVKSVTVDGAALGVADLKAHLGSYTFSNIQKDHTIHVVCVPYPVITIKKQITGNHVILAKGVPAFTYKIEGDDYLGGHRVYHRELSWPKTEPVAASKSISLKIPPGRYTITELSSNDWFLQSVQAGANASVSGKTVIVDTRNASAADGTFINDVSDWSKYTENDVEVNRLK